jgi:phthiocerol/phenolphthiocerol synthesis type-I polyketide synthase C
VKTNIGHLESAAGIAGLIKVILALRAREIPPHLHLREVNPDIRLDAIPAVIPTAQMEWRADDGPRVAGVSAFGFTGAIAHVLVEEAPPVTDAPTTAEEPARVLTLSARSPEALRDLANAYRAKLGQPDVPALRDLCFTASVRRTQHDHRLAAVGRSPTELAERLGAFVQEEARPGLAVGTRAASRKLVFVFPGQGGQWPGMARDLLEDPIFAVEIARVEAALRPLVDWSLAEVLRHPADPRLERIDVLQPTLFAVQLALSAVWRAQGVTPDAVVGHSMGEVAAACVAGVLPVEDGARVIARRSQLLRRASGKGGMAVVELPLEEAERAIRGHEHAVSVAASNGPTTTVLSGDPVVLAGIVSRLLTDEVFCRPVKVDVASHSPQMEPLRPELEAALAGIAPSHAAIPFHSTVTGALARGPELDAGYWVENLRRPVLFAPTVDRLVADGHDLFVEISPHPTLALGVREVLRRAGKEGAVLPSLRKEEPSRDVLLGSLGALWTAGHPVDWRHHFPEGSRVVPLPTYPWQRERFWIEPVEPSDTNRPRRNRTGAAALLGDRLRSPVLKDAIFESEISVAALPFLADHRIDGAVVVPGASHVARVLCAAAEVLGDGGCAIEDVTFPRALVLQEGEVRTAQLVLAPDGAFKVLSAPAGDEADEASWTLHALGTVRKLSGAPPERVPLDEVTRRCSEEQPGPAFYEEMWRAGYHLGPTFQWLEQLRFREREALATLRAPRTADEEHGHPLYPGLIDSCFQLVAATSRTLGAAHLAGSDHLYVPAGVTRFQFHHRPAGPLLCHVTVDPEAAGRPGELDAEIRIVDRAGMPIAEIGFRAKRIARELFLRGPGRRETDLFYRVDWQTADHDPSRESARPARTIVVVGGPGVVAGKLASRLAAAAERVILIRYDPAAGAERFAAELAQAFAGAAPWAIVHAAALDASAEDAADLGTSTQLGTHGLLHLVQALARAGLRDAPRLWIATAGAQGVEPGGPVRPAQAPVWGMARVLTHEHPELRPSCVDLSTTPGPIELDALAAEILADGREDAVALRGSTRRVARLVPHVPTERAREPAGATDELEPADGRPFRLEIDTPGVLENLVLREVPRVPPGPGEVEIAVRAAGINFVDVLSALGVRPDHVEGPTQLGGECAGVVTAVGEGVSDVRVGDAVIAMAPHCFRSFVTVQSPFVAPKPEHIGFEDAATLPITFMTAHWAMHHKARLAKGEKILIHAAAGGVGLAAVQLARWAGAEIFATAGSPEKRDFLRGLGIEHVMDSRSLAFASEVRERTGGRGVDVVLNCLTGEAIPKSLEALAAHGRFLEIGKRDIYENARLGLYPFHQNLAYFAVDLIRMYGEKPERCSALLREVVGLVAAGTLAPLPWTAFPASRAVDAFRLLGQARHIGKIVLTFPDPEARLARPAAPPRAALRTDGTYLLTGGLGGLGLAVARWMVENGAGHLVLAGRSAPSPEAQGTIAALERAGARVTVAVLDVADESAVRDLVARVDGNGPRLRGVVHAAGVLDDGLLLKQTPARFAAVMAPKIAGSFHLHRATRDRPLDFFVLFSGAGAILGSPGQANYAAANAFLDALAHERRAEGLPAVSIAWGPWSEVGLAARPDRAGQLALRGIRSLTPAQGVEAFGRIFSGDAPHVVALALDLRECLSAYPALAEAPLLAALSRGAEQDARAIADAPMRRALVAASVPARRPMLEAHLREQAAKVLGLSPSRIDPQRPLGSVGFDSLMTLDLRNRLEASLGLRLSATVVWNHPTVAALADHLARRMEIPFVAEVTPGPAVLLAEAARAVSRAAVEQLTDDEAAAALAERLGRLEAGSER